MLNSSKKLFIKLKMNTNSLTKYNETRKNVLNYSTTERNNYRVKKINTNKSVNSKKIYNNNNEGNLSYDKINTFQSRNNDINHIEHNSYLNRNNNNSELDLQFLKTLPIEHYDISQLAVLKNSYSNKNIPNQQNTPYHNKNLSNIDSSNILPNNYIHILPLNPDSQIETNDSPKIKNKETKKKSTITKKRTRSHNNNNINKNLPKSKENNIRIITTSLSKSNKKCKKRMIDYSLDELYIEQQKCTKEINELKRRCGKVLKKSEESTLTSLTKNTSWTILIKEMSRKAHEFESRTKFKFSILKKLSKSSFNYVHKKELTIKKGEIENIKNKKKIAKVMSRMVHVNFWNKIKKLTMMKINWQHEEERKNMFQERLDTFVEASSSYKDKISKSLCLNKSKCLIKDEENKDDDLECNIEVNEKERKKITNEETKKLMKKMDSVVPSGYTIETCPVKVPVSSLLRYGKLRDYQRIGVDWLVSLHENSMNGILADEMGLGKTIQTIALFAHLASKEENWGPHLLVVPTSVIVNWEMEFKRWLPGFKILTYYGTPVQRKKCRSGWNTVNQFHAIITSYHLIVQDINMFKRKKWEYLVLDEAHNIKNFRTKKWQAMLKLSTKHRLLLTGTPLQNNVKELWSLLHFLMPNVFASRMEFSEWFDVPMNSLLEKNQELNDSIIVKRLHTVMRPFILRRLKKEVEKQLPKKTEYIIKCKLSLRQRQLYEDFMNERRTKDILNRNHYQGMWNILMQLRKVCNHPDLFEGRPILSPFNMLSIKYESSSLIYRALEELPFDKVCLNFLNILFGHNNGYDNSFILEIIKSLSTKPEEFINQARNNSKNHSTQNTIFDVKSKKNKLNKLKKACQRAYVNMHKCNKSVIYGENLIRLLYVSGNIIINELDARKNGKEILNAISSMIKSPKKRSKEMKKEINNFICTNPAAVAPEIEPFCIRPNISKELKYNHLKESLNSSLTKKTKPFNSILVRKQMNFPDKRLIQWDCGKLQKLYELLFLNKKKGNRCLIFTQMAKMLNILEAFLNVYSYRYLRLDGSTKTDNRAIMMERFNTDESIFVFILSTRSGGFGINLTGANVVIFYDTDWNPAMDLQAQDRAHRIGQTREVIIYRLISTNTVEENICKIAEQKKKMNSAVIGDGNFTTNNFYSPTDIRKILNVNVDSSSFTPEMENLHQITQNARKNSEDVEDRKYLDNALIELKKSEDSNSMIANITNCRNKSSSNSSYYLNMESELLPIERYAINYDSYWLSITGFGTHYIKKANYKNCSNNIRLYDNKKDKPYIKLISSRKL